MKKVIYYSEPIGKEKIVLILETYKEEKNQSKEKLKNKNNRNFKNTGNFISVHDEGRNCIVDMTDPYWQYYFKTN